MAGGVDVQLNTRLAGSDDQEIALRLDAGIGAIKGERR